MRKMKMIAFLVVLYGMFIPDGLILRANSNYSFKHYNINNGLSQNTVRAIYQDRQGFMWFGTKDGLNRFDGIKFVIYKFSPDGNLNDNVFHRILQDRQDNIWVATDEGVYIFDMHKEEFRRFNHISNENDSVKGVVTEMVMDHDGDIWMSVEDAGIYHYSFEDDHLQFYAIPLVQDGMKMVSLCPDNNG